MVESSSLSVIFCAIALLTTACAEAAAPQCLDENGTPVDWYVIYNLPPLRKSEDFLLRRGLTYLYMTSSQDNSDWTLSKLSINDSLSIPGRTLASLYDNQQSDLLQILYNDQPPNACSCNIYGHTKGVVLGNNLGGLWLVHSIPQFPPVPGHGSKYSYPSIAMKLGQSFLCITLPVNQMNTVGQQLLYSRPKVFSSSIPENLSKAYETLLQVANKKYVKQAPWKNKAVLKSANGVEFTSYAKARAYQKELYSDWIAQDIGSDLQVNTWSNSEDALPSDCTHQFHVLNVLDLAITVNNSVPIQFKNSQEHSKWALTGSDKATVCIGGINRTPDQLRRGGGAVCFKNKQVWSQYSKAVQDVQPCPKP